MSTPLFELTIERLAYGGEGVGPLPSGKRVFVPLTVPGDRVAIALVEEKAQHARGRLVRLLEPGPARVRPSCRHADACGGCQLQQVAAAAQLAAKEDAFYQSLARLGGVRRADIPDARPIAASPRPLRYRTRCRLRVEGRALGFCGWRSRTVVPLLECPVLVPPLERLVLALAEALRERPLPAVRDLALCVGDDGGGAAALELAAPPAAATVTAAEELLRVSGLRGLVLLAPGRTPLERGVPVLSAAAPLAPGVRLLLRPDLFAQANAEATHVLAAAALDLLAPRPDEQALELYAGAGTFTFALARRAAAVTAVEEVGAALALMQRAAAEAAVANLSTRSGDAVQASAALGAEGRRFDVALVDPPRQGAKGLGPALARLGPRRVVYVSCDPATLARDVKALVGLGYAVRATIPVDMFPQSYHVEGVVLLTRGSEPPPGGTAPRPGAGRH